MQKWLAAGLMSCSLVSNPIPLFSQTPPTPAVAAPAHSAEYRPADEGWSVRLAKGWTTASIVPDPACFPETVFSRAMRHQLSTGGEVKVEMVAVRFKQVEPLSAAQKAVFVQGAIAEVEKKFGTVKKTQQAPKILGLPDSCIVEDWDVRVGSGGQFDCRLTYRVIVADHTAYMLFAGGEGGVTDTVRAVIDSFRIDPKETPSTPPLVSVSPSELRPRPVPAVVAKPPAVTDAANRPARNAPGPAAVTAPPKLPALFDALGHSAKNVGTEAEPIYELRFHRDGWNYVLKCQYSKDRQVLWVFSNVGAEGVDPSRLSPSAVLALLGENDKDRLAYFSFNADRKQFCLNTAIDPKQLSAQVLRERIDLLTAVIKETAPAWGALATDRK